MTAVTSPGNGTSIGLSIFEDNITATDFVRTVVEDCPWRQNVPQTQVGWAEIQSAVIVAGVLLIVVALALTVTGCSKFVSAILSPLSPESGAKPGLWLKQALFAGEDANLSLDAESLVDFAGLGLRFSLVGSVLAVILVPMYSSGSTPASPDFMRYTIANTQVKGAQDYFLELWFTVGAMYVLALTLMFLMHRQWHRFVGRRRQDYIKFAQCSDACPAQPDHFRTQIAHSVLVERLPRDVKTDEDLRRRFERVFPGDILYCRIPPDMCVQQDLRAIKCAGLSCCCRPCLKRFPVCLVNTEARLRACWRPIFTLFHRLEFGNQVTTGLVTFKSLVKRNAALQSVAIFSEEMHRWKIRAAPAVEDIIWENLPHSEQQAERRGSFVKILCLFGFSVWCLPFAFLVTVTNPVFLSEVFPSVMSFIQKYIPEFIHSILTAQLPMLGVQGLLTLLPKMFMASLTNFEGTKQKSVAQRYTMTRTFVFWVATYYMIALGGSTALSIWRSYVDQAVKRPLCVLTMLGTLLPQVAVYYIVAVVNQMASLPLLVVPVDRLWAGIRRKLEEGPIYLDIGYESLRLASVLNMACMFCVLCPLILPFCAVYFFLAQCAYRWSFQNLYGGPVVCGNRDLQAHDCHGGMWYELFPCAMLGLLLGSCAVTGVLLTSMVKAPNAWSPLLGVLALLVLIAGEVKFWLDCDRFKQLSEAMPYEDAATIDNDEAHAALVDTFDPDYYTDPSTHERLRARAHSCAAAVAAEAAADADEPPA
mmetsp:Transcript_20518/g.71004  ORF Transcript_20518/g.71004 Transcript_20518/m.71004 type:complete len:759 (+) Transcript_20518:35-2311(+)